VGSELLPGTSPLVPEEIVYEFESIQERLVPMRARRDRIKANPSSIVERVLVKSMPNLLNGQGAILMRVYHNEAKRSLYLWALRGKNRVLIDIGTGTAADLLKWKRASLVYCIEPEESILRKGLLRREQIETKVVIVPYRASSVDHKLIKRKANTVSMFFCLNRFEDEDFDGLERLIREKTQKECKVIGSFLDADRTSFVSNPVVKIEPDPNRKEWIRTTIHGTSVKEVSERPLEPKKILRFWRKLGFSKIRFQPMDAPGASPYEKELAHMFTEFAFSR
jgi:hypothetical protein